jgi:hypothetical protein
MTIISLPHIDTIYERYLYRGPVRDQRKIKRKKQGKMTKLKTQVEIPSKEMQFRVFFGWKILGEHKDFSSASSSTIETNLSIHPFIPSHSSYFILAKNAQATSK